MAAANFWLAFLGVQSFCQDEMFAQAISGTDQKFVPQDAYFYGAEVLTGWAFNHKLSARTLCVRISSSWLGCGSPLPRSA